MRHINQRRYANIPYPFNPEKPEKPGNVRTDGTLVYTAPETLHNEGIQIHPRYYIFRRKG